MNCRTYPAADCDTDHQLLVATLKVRLAKRQRQHSIQPLNLEELEKEKAVHFAAEVTKRFTALEVAQDEVTPEESLERYQDRPAGSGQTETISHEYSLFINVDKTKVMASDSIACRILIQNEQLEQVNTFPYLRSLITEVGECTTYQIKQRAGDRGITAENMEKSQHTDFNEDTTNESTSVACSNVWL